MSVVWNDKGTNLSLALLKSTRGYHWHVIKRVIKQTIRFWKKYGMLVCILYSKCIYFETLTLIIINCFKHSWWMWCFANGVDFLIITVFKVYITTETRENVSVYFAKLFNTANSRPLHFCTISTGALDRRTTRTLQCFCYHWFSHTLM